MKSFFKTFFASTLGVIVGFGLITIIGIFIISAIAMSSSSTYSLEDKTVFVLELNGTVNEQKEDNPLTSLFGGSSVGLNDILDAIKKAKENDEIKGIYIKASDLSAGIASLEPIRNALIDFKTSGKFIVSYADQYSQGTYYISSVADKVIMNPKGSLDFHGLASISMFSRGMYEKMGVKFQVFKVGTFKSAVEPYIQDKMSDANRLQVSSYLNDIWGHLLDGISKSRNISIENLNKYADECIAFSDAETVVKYNLVDTLMYRIDIEAYLKQLTETKEDTDLKTASIANLNSIKSKNVSKSKDKIAILYAEGAIMDDNMGGGLMEESTITPEQYVKELKKLRDDENVKAVVFRVNSPGGSAYASEQIWNAVVEVKKKKPIIVSMGDYAASGGYYISCAADTIVAEPTTITGSIGIFGLIPEGEELAKKMGVSFDEVKTNKHGAFGGRTFGIPFIVTAFSRGLNDDESKILQKYIEKGYDLFTKRCADGRSKTQQEIDSIGQGRVWTGKQALELGLVDKLGGIEDAIQIAAAKANLQDYKTVSYPKKKDFFTQLIESSLGGAKTRATKAIMGEDAYELNTIKNTLKSTDIQMAVMPDRINY